MSTTHSNDCPRTNDISTVTIKDRSPWKNHSLWWCCIYAVELKEKKRLLTLSLTVEFALMLASWANFFPYFNPSWSAIYLKKKIHGVKMLHVKFINIYQTQTSTGQHMTQTKKYLCTGLPLSVLEHLFVDVVLTTLRLLLPQSFLPHSIYYAFFTFERHLIFHHGKYTKKCLWTL